MVEYYPKRLSQIIDPWLWLGNTFAAGDVPLLQKTGIGRVLTITENPSKDESFYLKYGIIQKRFPIPDGEFQDPQERLVKEILPWVDEASELSLPTLIQCFGSVSRSPGFIITYFIWRGMNFWEAVNTVAQIHLYTAPAAVVLASYLNCLDLKLPADYKVWAHRRFYEVVKPLLDKEEDPTEKNEALRKANYGEEK